MNPVEEILSSRFRVFHEKPMRRKCFTKPIEANHCCVFNNSCQLESKSEWAEIYYLHPIDNEAREREASFCDCDKRVGGATNDGENEYTQYGLCGTDYKEMLWLCFRFLCWYVCLQNDIKFSMFAHMKHTTCTQNPTEQLSFGCEIRLLIVLETLLLLSIRASYFETL